MLLFSLKLKIEIWEIGASNVETIELDVKASRLHRKTGITLLAGFTGMLLIAVGVANELLLKTSIDRSRAFLSVEEGLSKACALQTPCDWLTLEIAREGAFVSLGNIETLGLGEDYIIEVSEEGKSATARPKGFFFGYAPSTDDIGRAYDVAAMSVDEFKAAPAIFSNF